MKPIIAPSVLACDFTDIRKEMNRINESSAEWIHFDVMDGVFVPNISFGFPILQAMRGLTSKTIDVHLMIVEPHKYFETFKEMGADHLSIHLEQPDDILPQLQKIQSLGMTAGIVLNPDTPIEKVFPYLKHTNLVLIMSVFPGFGGQAFIEATYDRVAQLKAEIIKQKVDVKIEVDGGVSTSNASKLIQCGANVLVSGSALFKASDFNGYIQQMTA